MRLKDLEKFKLIEAALMFGIPLGLIIFNNNPSVNDQTASWGEKLLNNSNN